MFPIKASVPSHSVPVVTRALILINVLVFFFELMLPPQSVEQIFYLFGIVPARFTHPDWAASVGFPIDNYWPLLNPPISARRVVPRHCKHVDTLDLRRQRRGTDGTGPIRDFLSALRHDRRLDAFADQRGFYGTVGRRLGRNRGRARRLSAVFPDGAADRSVPNLLFAVVLRGSSGFLPGNLGFQPAV